MPRLIWSQASLRDLRAIDTYLSEFDPAIAERILLAIRSRADQLLSFPMSGPPLEGDFRYLPVRTTPYVLVYLITRRGIEIARVRHAREDWRPS